MRLLPSAQRISCAGTLPSDFRRILTILLPLQRAQPTEMTAPAVLRQCRPCRPSQAGKRAGAARGCSNISAPTGADTAALQRVPSHCVGAPIDAQAELRAGGVAIVMVPSQLASALAACRSIVAARCAGGGDDGGGSGGGEMHGSRFIVRDVIGTHRRPAATARSAVAYSPLHSCMSMLPPAPGRRTCQ